MSRIEELVYSAYEYGKREVLFKKVNKIRQQCPTKSLDEVYDQAYSEIMNT